MTGSKKKEILSHFHDRCFVCEYRHFLDIHHIKPRSDGGEDTLENCVVLCANHHKEWHFIENTYYRRCAKANLERLNGSRDTQALKMDSFKYVSDYHENGKAPYVTVMHKEWWGNKNG